MSTKYIIPAFSGDHKDVNPIKVLTSKLIELGWKSFKVYHIGWKGPRPYYIPFLPYVLIPIKNMNQKLSKILEGLYFRLLQLYIPS
jgi:hypothetical protein